jgi:hypothetical protein
MCAISMNRQPTREKAIDQYLKENHFLAIFPVVDAMEIAALHRDVSQPDPRRGSLDAVERIII